MRFLHTADWQIGMKAAHVGAVAVRVRDERLAAATCVVNAAQDAGADFILLAGDTFEDNAVERVLVQKIADILASFRGSVFIIPGNHDPFVPGSVWEHPVWAEQPTLRVLREPAPVTVPGGTLYPCPALAKYSQKDPTAWIVGHAATGIKIGLAHGTVEGVAANETDYPIARNATERTGVDYLALGHWHSFSQFGERMAYSGSHETTKFGERDSGNALLVEIAAPGAVPQITPIKTGRLQWRQIETDLVQARQQVEALEQPGDTLLELRLSGLVHATERAELSRLGELVAARFLFSRLDTTLLRPAPEDTQWLAELPVGAVREAAERLLAWSDPASARPDGVRPEVAARALLELFTLMRETGR